LDIGLEVDAAFPPGVSYAGNLLDRLLLQIDLMLRGVDQHFVSPVTGRHLEHTYSMQVDLGKDSKGRELVRHYTGQPTSRIGRVAILSKREDLGRSHIFSAGTDP